MPRKTVKPKITYKQNGKPDQSAIDAVYDYLFDKMIMQK